jgi:hypothetical protein
MVALQVGAVTEMKLSSPQKLRSAQFDIMIKLRVLALFSLLYK